MLRASRVVEVDMQWDGYVDWIVSQLREFRPASRGIGAPGFADCSPATSPKLRPHEVLLLVEGSFEAHPF